MSMKIIFYVSDNALTYEHMTEGLSPKLISQKHSLLYTVHTLVSYSCSNMILSKATCCH